MPNGEKSEGVTLTATLANKSGRSCLRALVRMYGVENGEGEFRIPKLPHMVHGLGCHLGCITSGNTGRNMCLVASPLLC